MHKNAARRVGSQAAREERDQVLEAEPGGRKEEQFDLSGCKTRLEDFRVSNCFLFDLNSVLKTNQKKSEGKISQEDHFSDSDKGIEKKPFEEIDVF